MACARRHGHPAAPARSRHAQSISTGFTTFRRGSTSWVNRRIDFSLSAWVMWPLRPTRQICPKPPDLVVELHDLPIDAVRRTREQDALLHRLLGGDVDQLLRVLAGGGDALLGVLQPQARLHLRLGAVQARCRHRRRRAGQEPVVLRRRLQRGVQEPQQLAADADERLCRSAPGTRPGSTPQARRGRPHSRMVARQWMRGWSTG